MTSAKSIFIHFAQMMMQDTTQQSSAPCLGLTLTADTSEAIPAFQAGEVIP